jgi:hypothetical protein
VDALADALNSTPASTRPPATEDANKARLRTLLEAAHFEVYPEVYVREPMRGMTVRMDFALIPNDGLLDAGMPFDVIGVEVKRSPLTGSGRRHALGQCIAYRNCVLVDRRLPALRGLAIPVVVLYAAGDSYRGDFFSRTQDMDAEHLYGEVRLAATQNVGLLVHHQRDGLTLEIADEPIWCVRRGVTGVGANWPRARRFANGSSRTP